MVVVVAAIKVMVNITFAADKVMADNAQLRLRDAGMMCKRTCPVLNFCGTTEEECTRLRRHGVLSLRCLCVYKDRLCGAVVHLVSRYRTTPYVRTPANTNKNESAPRPPPRRRQACVSFHH